MLTREENERVTRVGPGTPLGALLRRYWLPALLVNEIPSPDCPPVRVKLLGEELVAFRDTRGQIGLLAEHCPHRQASLFLGRNEQEGLRCVFHGWKLDVAGRCVEMPTEPPESRFKDKVRQPAYPTVELGGVIWTYMGPPETQPGPPAMPWLRAPETYRFVSKTVEYCNYLQGIEGGIDTAHSSYLHNNNLADGSGFRQIDTAPQLEVERTDYGFRYAGIRDVGDEGNYVRIYQFVLPFQQFRAHQLKGRRGSGRVPIPQVRGHLWVPMDDEQTMVFNWMHALEADKPFTPEAVAEYEASAGRGPEGETTVRHRTRANDWLIDREIQRTRTYTGIAGVNTQDLAVQESMGPIADRTREHLGSTDKAIIMLRRILLEAIATVEQGGAPPGVDPATYRDVRAIELILPKDARWQDAARAALVADGAAARGS
jgi:phenylpropionate dioxygenase-like ring-hydroxylating dioxygenase large terminal subunit